MTGNTNNLSQHTFMLHFCAIWDSGLFLSQSLNGLQLAKQLSFSHLHDIWTFWVGVQFGAHFVCYGSQQQTCCWESLGQYAFPSMCLTPTQLIFSVIFGMSFVYNTQCNMWNVISNTIFDVHGPFSPHFSTADVRRGKNPSWSPLEQGTISASKHCTGSRQPVGHAQAAFKVSGCSGSECGGAARSFCLLPNASFRHVGRGIRAGA